MEILRRFWRRDAVPANKDMVHPLLVYADLMATGNQRNIETARVIYDQHVIQLVWEIWLFSGGGTPRSESSSHDVGYTILQGEIIEKNSLKSLAIPIYL